MKKIIDDLAKLGKEIDAAKTSVSQLEGRKTEIVKRLQEEFSVSTLEEAEKLLVSREKELEKDEQDIRKSYDVLKESFSW